MELWPGLPKFEKSKRLTLSRAGRWSHFKIVWSLLCEVQSHRDESSIDPQGAKMPLLGVNIDHVATVRQARRTIEPDPVHAR